MNGKQKIFRVTELTRLIKTALEGKFGDVCVEGEISNLRRPSSGHFYFTLKDENAQLSSVMFRGNQATLKFQPRDGMLVQAFGQISVYEKSGNYQIIVRQMQEAGKGSLQAAFEALKLKLKAEGLFDSARKKPLPLLPRHIGIVTSPTGAAIRDMLKVLTRRYPNLHILIAPVKVQGEGAAAEIAAAINYLNSRGGLDVLIVGRGGGSLEDLWAFNEEVVARAIAGSGIPVISAVGHEIDFTISDFVADLRAPTPSAAAEQVIGLKDLFENKLQEYGLRLLRPLRETLLRARSRLVSATASDVFARPRNVAQQYRQRIGEIRLRMTHSLQHRLQETQQRLDEASIRTLHEKDRHLDRSKQQLQQISVQLRALNPHAVLFRGYSITRNDRGEVLRSATKTRNGERIVTRLSDGELESQITGIKK